MMRTGIFALLLFMAACGDSGGGGGATRDPGNQARLPAPGDQRDAAATVTLAASGPGGCSARWEGQPATPQQVLDRSSALVEHAIDDVGGVTNLTEETIPTIAVVAPANLGFGCADTYLSAIRRAAVPTVLLTPQGGQDAALADFTLSDIGAPPPTVVLVIGAGGRLTWNGEAISLDAIPDRMHQLGGGGATEIEAPAGELELRPAREASFGQVHEVLRAVRAGHVRAALLLPSVPPAPVRPAPAPAAPPSPAPEPGNEATPAAGDGGR
jgi:hypothetical protein